jgi:hypothetical protein
MAEHDELIEASKEARDFLSELLDKNDMAEVHDLLVNNGEDVFERLRDALSPFDNPLVETEDGDV